MRFAFRFLLFLFEDVMTRLRNYGITKLRYHVITNIWLRLIYLHLPNGIGHFRLRLGISKINFTFCSRLALKFYNKNLKTFFIFVLFSLNRIFAPISNKKIRL